MNLLQWATSPWGQSVPIHIAWSLIWIAVIFGFCFMVMHSLYLIIVKPPKRFAERKAEVAASGIPERVPRHTLAARMFHWVMAASMITLLITAFLPKVGVQFNWVVWHWIAGLVLTASILFHVIHATFFLDFWSIWPDRTDLNDARNRTLRFFGKDAPLPSKFAKYPLENKLYHGVVMLAGLAVMGTGLFMMKRVETGVFVRNPYLFSDMTWGWMYVLHGLAGVGFVALTLVHVYMGVRPEKLPITKSMIFGWMSRDFYLEEHDTERWAVKGTGDSELKRGLSASDGD
jgi:cytochrome b subunit of formate dehydrogenase